MKMNQTSSDRKFFWLVTVGVVCITALPFLFGWAITPPNYQFYGNSVISPADPSVYYAYIEQGRGGHILMYDAFTSEPHQAVLWQPVWWVVGLLAQILNLSTPLAFMLARWLAVPVLLSAIWWTVRWLWSDPVRQRTGFILAAGGGGLGGLIMMFAPQWLDFSGRTAPDLWVSEAYPILSALTTAHFLLVTAGLLFTLVAIERATEQRSWRLTGWAGLVLLLTISIHPFHIITLVTVWVAMTILRWIRSKKFPMVYVLRWVSVSVMTLPALAYYSLQLWLDPLVAGRAAQNVNLMTNVLRTLIGLGAFFPLALFAFHKRRDECSWWLMCWGVAIVFLVYAPAFNFQRRLSQGMIIPFAFLAAPLVADWWQRRGRRAAVFSLAAILLFFISPLLVIILNMHSYLQERQGHETYLYYLSPEYKKMGDYLKTQPHDQAVMATVTNGRVLASLSAHQVFLGYAVETLEFDRKFELMKSFYGNLTQPEQAQLLAREHLCYIVDGPREQAYGSAFQPLEWQNLERVVSGPTMQLYYVTGCRSV